MISKEQELAGIILLSTAACWLLTTFLTVNPADMTWISYSQVIGLLIGVVVGVLISAFVINPLTIEKIRRETFSFIGIILALSLFIININLPRGVVTYVLTSANTMGFPLFTDGTVMFLSFVVSALLVLIIVAFYAKLIEN